MSEARRQFARYQADLPKVLLRLPDGSERTARVRDESFDGFGVELDDAGGLRLQMPVEIELQDGFGRAIVQTIKAHDDEVTVVGLRWLPEDPDETLDFGSD
jgi:hypothetical protein